MAINREDRNMYSTGKKRQRGAREPVRKHAGHKFLYETERLNPEVIHHEKAHVARAGSQVCKSPPLSSCSLVVRQQRGLPPSAADGLSERTTPCWKEALVRHS